MKSNPIANNKIPNKPLESLLATNDETNSKLPVKIYPLNPSKLF